MQSRLKYELNNITNFLNLRINNYLPASIWLPIDDFCGGNQASNCGIKLTVVF